MNGVMDVSTVLTVLSFHNPDEMSRIAFQSRMLSLARLSCPLSARPIAGDLANGNWAESNPAKDIRGKIGWA
jgi:hypothetical protein